MNGQKDKSSQNYSPSKAWRRYIKSRIRNTKKFGFINYFRALRKEPKLNFENFLSIVSIAKNEGKYLKEWIDYHSLVGVEKFYIYDNNSSDDTKSVLEPYIAKGIVEYKFFPGDKRQMPAYHEAIDNYKNKSKWIAFIDLDEFIVPVENETVADFLRIIPENVRQLLAGWMIYGSSGFETSPEGLVIENYKYHMEENYDFQVKAIINPRFVAEFNTPHFAEMAGITVDENLNKITKLPGWPLPKDKIRINHYHCKSKEEYAHRVKRGNAALGQNFAKYVYTDEFFKNYDRNDIFDSIMDKYIPALKK